MCINDGGKRAKAALGHKRVWTGPGHLETTGYVTALAALAPKEQGMAEHDIIGHYMDEDMRASCVKADHLRAAELAAYHK